MKVELGGKRLHSGNKIEVEMHPYRGAMHNLNKTVRTSMTTGTLVPIYTNIALPGDKFNINLNAAIRTLPTIGPLFGSFQLTVDFFATRLSLYNKLLHNNRTSLARNMQKVYLPRLQMQGPNVASYLFRAASIKDPNKVQISQSSIMAYLGKRGLGHAPEMTAGSIPVIKSEEDATFLLNYWDIVKEYYANKQEKFGWVVSSRIDTVNALIGGYGELSDSTIVPPTTIRTIATNPNSPFIVKGSGLRFRADGTSPVIFRYYPNYNTTGDITTYQDIEYDPAVNGWQMPNGYLFRFSIIQPDTSSRYGSQVMAINRIGPGTAPISIVPSNEVTTTSAVELERFPLENIEKMRDAILAQDASVPLVLNSTNLSSDYLFNLPYSTANTLSTAFPNGDNVFEGTTTAAGRMAGLALKTYKGDRFNNWLNTEFVEQLLESVSVGVTNSKVSINELNTAERLYNIEARIAATAQTYKGWIMAVYGLSPHIEAEMPIYKGGLEGEIVFDEVISNSATGDEPLGTLAGRGDLKGGGASVHIHAEEPMLIMGIASITPRIGYTEGNRWHTRLQTFDDLHKPEYDGIGYQPLLTDEMAAWSTPMSVVAGDDILVPSYNSVGKQVAWAEYMTDVDENYGDFAEKGAAEFMVLNRDYEAKGESSNVSDFSISDATTYIDPQKHNYAFASTALEAHNFWLHLGMKIRAYRLVANKQIPRI